MPCDVATHSLRSNQLRISATFQVGRGQIGCCQYLVIAGQKKRLPNGWNVQFLRCKSRDLKRICGVDLVAVHGISVPLAQTIVMEVGTDMSKFPNEKHFCSWLGLAPKNEISGGKILVSRTLKTRNRAGQAFRLATVSIMRADCVFGVYYRRMKSRLGPAQATVATAHFIARVVYRMLKYQVEYEPLSVSEYENRYRDQQIKYLEKRAAKFGFLLSQIPA